MRRIKSKNEDEKADITAKSCPACGNIVRYGKTDEAVLYFACKKCTTRFQITVRRPDQAELEQAYIDSDIGTGQAPPQRIMEADPDGPGVPPIRLNRPRSRPASRPRPGIVHKALRAILKGKSRNAGGNKG